MVGATPSAAGRWVLSVGREMVHEMARHTTFRFCLDPTVEQHDVLARHAGASRFAFNQCLRIVKTGLAQRKSDPTIEVPWTGFDLINAFNGWKKTEDAGRLFAVDSDGVAEVSVTGLSWRGEVRCASRYSRKQPSILARALSPGPSRDQASARAGGSASRGSRRKPPECCRFGCATNTPRDAHRLSGSVTTAGNGR
jgi:hypothetical protein